MPRMSPVRTGFPHGANLRAAPQLREYAEIVARISHDAPELILDWGCGYGQVSSMLATAGLRVDSFDHWGPDAPNAVMSLPSYPEIHAYISSEHVALPYGDSRFNAVLSCGVLEHVKDPDGSLEEIKRVLTPGGLLYCFKLPNRYSYIEALCRTAGLYHHGRDEFDRLYTLGSARALVERHGFAVREAQYANMLPLLLPGAWARAAEKQIWGLNRALSRIPCLRLLATNIELVARAPR